jgi:hypothetical protein
VIKSERKDKCPNLNTLTNFVCITSCGVSDLLSTSRHNQAKQLAQSVKEGGSVLRSENVVFGNEIRQREK